MFGILIVVKSVTKKLNKLLMFVYRVLANILRTDCLNCEVLQFWVSYFQEITRYPKVYVHLHNEKIQNSLKQCCSSYA